MFLFVGLSKAAPEAGFGMTNLLQKSPNSSSRIAQECLRVFASLLRVCSDWAPTTSQLRFLVTWSLSDIEEAASQVAAFNLLRAIISRKLVIPEVYDVMNNVEDIMIRSQVILALVVATILGTHLQFDLVKIIYTAYWEHFFWAPTHNCKNAICQVFEAIEEKKFEQMTWQGIKFRDFGLVLRFMFLTHVRLFMSMCKSSLSSG